MNPAHTTTSPLPAVAWIGLTLFTIGAVATLWFALHPRPPGDWVKVERGVTATWVIGLLLIVLEALNRHTHFFP